MALLIFRKLVSCAAHFGIGVSFEFANDDFAWQGPAHAEIAVKRYIHNQSVPGPSHRCSKRNVHERDFFIGGDILVITISRWFHLEQQSGILYSFCAAESSIVQWCVNQVVPSFATRSDKVPMEGGNDVSLMDHQSKIVLWPLGVLGRRSNVGTI